MSEPDDHTVTGVLKGHEAFLEAVTPAIVATLRLPIPMRPLQALADALEATYGPGLRMRNSDDGQYLVITLPDRPAGD